MPVIVANRKEQTDGTMHRIFEMVQSKLPIVLMSKTRGFKFNDSLSGVKDYVLVEVSELGWDWNWNENGSHRWGINIDKFPQFSENEHYQRFNDWVAANPPKLTFQRELLKQDVSDTVKPIDYPAWFATGGVQSKAEFGRRIISLFSYWGRSSERRLSIHGSIWLNAVKNGHCVVDNIYYLEKAIMEERGSIWVTLNIPHYHRISIENILKWNGMSKLGLSLRGAGRKCFRTQEVSINSVLCKHEDELAYSYEWVHGENCIEIPYGETENCIEEMEAIELALKRDDLYEIYRDGATNCSKYHANTYVKDYIEPIINAI